MTAWIDGVFVVGSPYEIGWMIEKSKQKTNTQQADRAKRQMKNNLFIDKDDKLPYIVFTKNPIIDRKCRT